MEPNESASSLVGWLVDSWALNVAGLSDDQLAAKAHVVAQTAKNWRHGRRRPDIELLDRVFRADGTFTAIARAADTPVGLEPRRRWEATFTDGLGPVWVWLRPTPDASEVRADLSYGPFARRCDHPCDHRGVFITSPLSGGQPSLIVDFDEYGWADFGRGEPPVGLGIPVMSPFPGSSIRTGARLLPKVIKELKTSFSNTEPGLASLARSFDLDESYAHAVLETFREAPLPDDLLLEARASTLPDFRDSGPKFKRLRLARQLSVRSVADAINAMLPDDQFQVSTDHLDRFERGAPPRPPMMLPRLDTVLKGGGIMSCEEVPVRRRDPYRWQPLFPEFWVGPVWLKFENRNRTDSADVSLHWFPWRKPLRVKAGQVVTTYRVQKAAGPLLVSAPDNWTVEAGVGEFESAIDVREGWTVSGREGLQAIMVEFTKGINEMIARTRRRNERGVELL